MSHSFTLLLVAFVIASPASGAFVGLSQAALMDADTSRHEQNMARWTLAGSLGNVAGPIALSAVVLAGASWRSLFAVMVGLTLLLLAVVWRFPFATPLRHGAERAGEGFSLKDGVRGAFVALRRREILRWLILLELADLTWDVLRGFLALYFVDVVGTSESQAALAVIVWTVVGLPGDVLLIPLLERIEGLRYLRWSALAVLILFPAFLLAPGVTTKMVLLGLLGFANAGWYSILKAQLYGAMPGQSGTVLTLGNVSGLFAGMIPLALGIAAERFGMATMMWLLLAGPAVMLVGLISPQRRRAKPQRTAK